MSIESGVLYVVATPIGNLGDISTRALQVLGEVDYIAAEDTRHSARLLSYFGIKTPMLSYHEHNERNRTPQLLKRLQAGITIALISDAGTPLISDPGYQLVRQVRDLGLKVIAVPGPSSVLAALSIAGLPTDRFVFEGFLPAKSGARRNRLQALSRTASTMVFFESGRRIQDSVKDMVDLLGAGRRAMVARELTKVFEESHSATLAELCCWLGTAAERSRGEFVVIVHGAEEQAGEIITLAVDKLLGILLEELPPGRAANAAAKLTGLRRKQLYDLALTLRKPSQ